MSFFRTISEGRFNNLYLFSDGGIRLDPPAASSAVVVKDEKGQVVDWFSRLSPSMTNNEAEYYGLLDALAVVGRLRPNKAFLHLDSQIVVGRYRALPS